MKNTVLLFLTILCYLNSNSQVSDSLMVKRIVDETMTHATAYHNLKVLCKQVGARLSGSPQFLKAVTVTTKMMKEAGADTVYTQECMVPHWIRGPKEEGSFISDGKKYDLHLCALGGSEGTGTKGISAPVIEVRSMRELD